MLPAGRVRSSAGATAHSVGIIAAVTRGRPAIEGTRASPPDEEAVAAPVVRAEEAAAAASAGAEEAEEDAGVAAEVDADEQHLSTMRF